MRKIIRTKIEANINDALVLEARDAEEALTTVRTGTCHLVIYSAEVPGMALVEVFEEMRQVPSDWPLAILLMTAGEEEMAIRKVAATNISGYLLVPCKTRILISAIERACSPVTMRRSKRYSIAHTHAILEQKESSFQAQVINISAGGALCQLDAAAKYRWSSPAMLTLVFSLPGEQHERIPGFFSIPVHVNVVESNPDFSPRRIRIAYSFINPPELSLQALQKIFSQIGDEQSHD